MGGREAGSMSQIPLGCKQPISIWRFLKMGFPAERNHILCSQGSMPTQQQLLFPTMPTRKQVWHWLFSESKV